MRFLVDECAGPAVAEWLQQNGHTVFSAFNEAKGATDDQLLTKAAAEDWILITNDKDFGEMIFRERRPHRGVIFLRLSDETSINKIAVLRKVLSAHSDMIAGHFVTATETRIRIS